MRVAGLAIPSSRIFFLAPTIGFPEARESLSRSIKLKLFLDIPQFARGIIRCEPPQPVPLNPACRRTQAQNGPWGELSYVSENKQ
jgi:hypothetical protein